MAPKGKEMQVNRVNGIVRKCLFGALGLALAGAALVPGPAAAQFMGPSYKFLEAIKKKDGEGVEKALGDGGPNLINTKDVTTGDTALHLVTARRDLQWMGYVIYKGANVNARNEKGVTPLSLAVGLNFVEGVDLLLAQGARVNDPGADGETPLIAAVHQRSVDLVRTLIKAGADPRRADNSGRNALDYAHLSDKGGTIATELESAAKAAAARQKRTYGPSF